MLAISSCKAGDWGPSTGLPLRDFIRITVVGREREIEREREREICIYIYIYV